MANIGKLKKVRNLTINSISNLSIPGGTGWGDKGYGYLDAENYVAELSVFAVEGFLVSLPKTTS